MKAITQDRYGEAEVLTLSEIPRPEIGANEVLVRVAAAGLDQGVWHLMSGIPTMMRLGTGRHAPKQPVSGTDVAGTIEQVGANVTGFAPGDQVYGIATGTFAEFARANPKKLTRMPANLTTAQAAAVPISGVTALQAVRGRIHPGDRVLVLGAAGGVGSFVVQLAKHFGGEVPAVASAAKHDFVRELGADHVHDYRDGDPVGPFELIVDTGGNRSNATLKGMLTPTGTAVLVGGEGGGGDFLAGFERQIFALLPSPFSKKSVEGLVSAVKLPDLLELTELIEAGTITPAIDSVYPLAEAADAMRHLRAGAVRGKVVISVAPLAE
ncbi:NAD(P)-dependent alcohol dehydrogenase [soil metagenome]